MPEELGVIAVKYEADIGDLTVQTTRAKGVVSDFTGQALKDIEKHRAGLMTLGIGMAGVGGAAVAMASGTVKSFATFDQAMRNVQSVIQGSEQDFQTLEQDFQTLSEYALKLGKDTAFSATEAGQALYYMASAGFSVKQQMDATGAVLELAAATQSDLARSSELVATTIKAFGMEAKDAGRISDVMAKSIASSQATFDKLAYSMPYVATQAHQLGYSLEDTAAALSVLYDGGLKGEMAGERLRGALNDLLNPTDKAAMAMKQMGINIADVNPATHSLVEIVKQFQEHGLNAANAGRIFGERAEGMTVLVGQGSAKLEEMTKKMYEAGGAAQKMADIQLKSLSGAFEQMKGSIETATIKFGQTLAPTVESLANLIKNLADRFSDLPKSMQTVISHAALLGGGLTALTGGGLLLLTQIPQMVAGFKALSSMLETVRIAAMVAGSSISAMAATSVVALGALAATIWAVKQAHDAWTKAGNDAAGQMSRAKDALKEQQQALDNLKESFRLAKEKGLDPTTMSIGQLMEATRYAAFSYSDMEKGLGGTVNQSMKASTVMGALEKSVDRTSKAIDGASDKHKDIKKAQEDAAKATEGLMNKFTQQNAAISETEKKLTDAEKAYGKLRESTSGAIEDFQKISETLEKKTNPKMDALGNVSESSGVKIRTMDASIGTLKENLDRLSKESPKGMEEAFANAAVAFKQYADQAQQTAVEYLNSEGYVWQKNMIAILDAGLALEEQYAVMGERLLQQMTTLEEKDAARFQKTSAAKQSILEEDYQTALEYIADLDDANIKARDKELSEIEKFYRNKIIKHSDNYNLQRSAVIDEYDEMLALFQKHGVDIVALQQWENDQLSKLQQEHWLSYANELDKGLSNVGNVYRGIWELFNNTEMKQDDFHKKSLVRFSDWVGKQTELINDLADTWNNLSGIWSNALSIINKLTAVNAVATTSTTVDRLDTIMGPLTSGATVSAAGNVASVGGAGELAAGGGVLAKLTSALSSFVSFLPTLGMIAAGTAITAKTGGVFKNILWGTGGDWENGVYREKQAGLLGGSDWWDSFKRGILGMADEEEKAYQEYQQMLIENDKRQKQAYYEQIQRQEELQALYRETYLVESAKLTAQTEYQRSLMNMQKATDYGVDAADVATKRTMAEDLYRKKLIPNRLSDIELQYIKFADLADMYLNSTQQSQQSTQTGGNVTINATMLNQTMLNQIVRLFKDNGYTVNW